jgi:pyranose oxidase
VLKRSIIESIPNDPRFKRRVDDHKAKFPKDPLPIPFDDPEPQVLIPYSSSFPYHVQIHRDAFSYGNIGPKADPRLIVDLRFFGKQEIKEKNSILFGKFGTNGWEPGVTDIYGMPQATVCSLVPRGQGLP